MRPPTDFKILKTIDKLYRKTFEAQVNDPKSAHHLKTYVPIDVTAVAERLGVDQNSVFGRLHYHLEEKYGYTRAANDDKADKPLFSIKVGPDRHCVNFPLLEAVLAGLWQEWRRDLWAMATAALSLGVAFAALLVSIFLD